jgi:REP element-mobilizing transposase RayT
MSTKILLEPDKYYHIYNHAISEDNLFRNEKDYLGFICRYIKHVVPVSETIAYCFMPNHFHLCIKIKGINELFAHSRNVKLEVILSRIYRHFADFLNGYVQAYNKRYNRIGGLFVGNFKRKPLYFDDDLRRLVCYIHNNPIEANFVSYPDEWAYSSYSDLITQSATPKIPLCTQENLRIFNDLENFKYMHTIKYPEHEKERLLKFD